MAKKSGMEHMANAARTAKALKDIIKALMQGGWQAAAMQALKHYWPQILAAALVLLLLPVIIFCCLPAMLFGFGGAADTAVSAAGVQAGTVSGYYDKYEAYCKTRIAEIKASVTGGENSGKDDTVHQTEETESVTYEVSVSGEAMEKNWFISLHSVSAGNNLNAMDEQSVKDFVAKSIVYTVEDKPEETAASGGNPDTTGRSLEESRAGKGGGHTKVLAIRYLTPPEFMEEYGYSDADRNWAQLMYRSLQEKKDTSQQKGRDVDG